MKDLPLPVTKKTLEERFAVWLKIIKNDENGVILFFPKTDRHRRIPQFIKDKAFLAKHLNNPDKYLFLNLDLGLFPYTDFDDLLDFLCEEINDITGKSCPSFGKWLTSFEQNGEKLVLMVNYAEMLLEKHNQIILLSLARLAEDYPSISILLLAEKDVSNPIYRNLFSSRTVFLQNLTYYPLYTEDDVRQFINYLSLKWEIPAPEKIIQEIVNKCGGHFWLIKQVFRNYRDSKNTIDIFNHPDIQLRLNTIYNDLLDSEKSLLKKIVFENDDFDVNEKHSLKYLQKMGLIDINNKITILLLYEHIKNRQDKKSEITQQNGDILFRNIPISTFFSRKESRVIKKFIEEKNNLVTREEVAKQLWPVNTEKYYSDWAIDQIITRIRKKLTKLYISPTALVTVKGKGYKFSI